MKKGKVKEVHFVVAGDRIPTLNEQPVKSLGRWYAQPLTDRHRGMQVQKQLVQCLSTIDGYNGTSQGVGYIRQQVNSQFLKLLFWMQDKWAEVKT